MYPKFNSFVLINHKVSRQRKYSELINLGDQTLKDSPVLVAVKGIYFQISSDCTNFDIIKTPPSR